MKNMLLTLGLLFVMNANATIEYLPDDHSRPTEQEIATNRSCFKDLEAQGCGDPGEDPQHFRLCMNNVYGTLDADCKVLMSNLYGKK